MLHDILVEITEFLTASRGCLKCDTNIGDSVTFDLGLAEFDLIYSTKKKKMILKCFCKELCLYIQSCLISINVHTIWCRVYGMKENIKQVI